MKTIPIVQLLIGMAVAGSAWAQNPLDDTIYSMKCLGADDKEACKAKARQDFEDYQRQKQAGGASAATIGTTAPAEKCQSVSAKGAVDVDTAYARAISTFHFQTHEEKTHYGQRPRLHTMLDDGYKHVRTPGAIYQLWDQINLYWPARNKTVYFYGGTTLQKDRSGAMMTARYCLQTIVAEYSDPAFWQFADDAFRNLVQ
jgi:hypothetical protein